MQIVDISYNTQLGDKSILREFIQLLFKNHKDSLTQILMIQVLNYSNSPEIAEMLYDYANRLENLAVFDFSESELEPDVLANLIVNLSFAAPSLKSVNLSGRQE